MVRYACDFFNVDSLSPTSQSCHQYKLSPTSVTNIALAGVDFEAQRFEPGSKWTFGVKMVKFKFGEILSKEDVETF